LSKLQNQMLSHELTLHILLDSLKPKKKTCYHCDAT